MTGRGRLPRKLGTPSEVKVTESPRSVHPREELRKEEPQARQSDHNGWGSNEEATECMYCKGPHVSKDCDSKPRQKTNYSVTRCANCEGRGHSAGSCPSPRLNDYSENTSARPFQNNERSYRNNGSGNPRDFSRSENFQRDRVEITCYRCSKTGHRGDDCPDRVGYSPSDASAVPYNRVIDVTEEDIVSRNNTGIKFDRLNEIGVEILCADETILRRCKGLLIESFESADLSTELLEIIHRLQYKTPTPVQKYCIPIIKEGKDMLVCAQTGSGKTAAFVLPIVDMLLKKGISPSSERTQYPEVLILAPTRELVQQITKDAKTYCMRTEIQVKESFGGIQLSAQMRNISRGCNILVGTTGRTKDLLGKNVVNLSHLKYLVLDEADRMLDMGFSYDLKDILGYRPTGGKLQTLMFSATFPQNVRVLVRDYLSEDFIKVEVGITGTVNQDVEQRVEECSGREKRRRLTDLVRQKISGNKDMKILVFVATKKTADFLASFLSESDIGTTSMHGDRLQQQRDEALADFQKGRKPVLIATSVAARGLDIKNVNMVINYDLPNEIEEYIHRVGRTGRVGNSGLAISFYDDTRDRIIANELRNALADSNQIVPDFLLGNSDVGVNREALQETEGWI